MNFILGIFQKLYGKFRPLIFQNKFQWLRQKESRYIQLILFSNRDTKKKKSKQKKF